MFTQSCFWSSRVHRFNQQIGLTFFLTSHTKHVTICRHSYSSNATLRMIFRDFSRPVPVSRTLNTINSHDFPLSVWTLNTSANWQNRVMDLVGGSHTTEPFENLIAYLFLTLQCICWQLEQWFIHCCSVTRRPVALPSPWKMLCPPMTIPAGPSRRLIMYEEQNSTK